MSQTERLHPGTAPRPNGSEEMFREGLALIAEGVTELAGFGLACISVVRQTPDGATSSR